MRAADCVVDIGPGAGEHGGELVAIGTAEDLMKNEFHHRKIPERKTENSGSGRAQKADGMADGKGRRREQSEKYQCEVTAWCHDLCYRSFRFGKEFSCQ